MLSELSFIDGHPQDFEERQFCNRRLSTLSGLILVMVFSVSEQLAQRHQCCSLPQQLSVRSLSSSEVTALIGHWTEGGGVPLP